MLPEFGQTKAVYNAAITATHQWHQALLLALKLFERGPEPSCLTGNAAAHSAYKWGGRWRLAIEVAWPTTPGPCMNIYPLPEK